MLRLFSRAVALVSIIGFASPVLAQSCGGCSGVAGKQVCSCLGQKECACATSCSCSAPVAGLAEKVESQVAVVERSASSVTSKTVTKVEAGATAVKTVPEKTVPEKNVADPAAISLAPGGGSRQE